MFGFVVISSMCLSLLSIEFLDQRICVNQSTENKHCVTNIQMLVGQSVALCREHESIFSTSAYSTSTAGRREAHLSGRCANTYTNTHKNAQSCSIYAQEAEMNDGEWVASLKARC